MGTKMHQDIHYTSTAFEFLWVMVFLILFAALCTVVYRWNTQYDESKLGYIRVKLTQPEPAQQGSASIPIIDDVQLLTNQSILDNKKRVVLNQLFKLS
jgi:hypothetical protein